MVTGKIFLKNVYFLQIIDKEVEPIDPELSQSAALDIDNGAEVSNKPEESEKGVFVIGQLILNQYYYIYFCCLYSLNCCLLVLVMYVIVVN